jgi:hypothetical protein
MGHPSPLLAAHKLLGEADMRLLALALLLTTSCMSHGGDRPLFVGSTEVVEIAANAARQCGVRNARFGRYEGETALFIPSEPRYSAGKDCLYEWWREQRPPDLAMIVVTR